MPFIQTAKRAMHVLCACVFFGREIAWEISRTALVWRETRVQRCCYWETAEVLREYTLLGHQEGRKPSLIWKGKEELLRIPKRRSRLRPSRKKDSTSIWSVSLTASHYAPHREGKQMDGAIFARWLSK